jgi:hypothetical protein
LAFELAEVELANLFHWDNIVGTGIPPPPPQPSAIGCAGLQQEKITVNAQ